ncbi:hypothetical protein ACFQU7_33425 [Pseudoroseomonas wenyumeiae]
MAGRVAAIPLYQFVIFGRRGVTYEAQQGQRMVAISAPGVRRRLPDPHQKALLNDCDGRDGRSFTPSQGSRRLRSLPESGDWSRCSGRRMMSLRRQLTIIGAVLCAAPDQSEPFACS